MIRTELDLRPLMPFTRLTAARLATAAGRYESRLTLECEGLVLNMKSMLGLLSQAKLPDGRAMLVADGRQDTDSSRQKLLAGQAMRVAGSAVSCGMVNPLSLPVATGMAESAA